MNGEPQLVIGPVRYLVLSKRHVADGKIVEIPPVRGFKTGYRNIRLGIKLFCDASADGIQLHTVQTGAGHFLWQHTEEVADAAGWFQNIASGKTHVADSFINGADDRGAGVVGIQGRRSG